MAMENAFIKTEMYMKEVGTKIRSTEQDSLLILLATRFSKMDKKL